MRVTDLFEIITGGVGPEGLWGFSIVYTCTTAGASCTGRYIFWSNHPQEDKWKSKVCSTPFKVEKSVPFI